MKQTLLFTILIAVLCIAFVPATLSAQTGTTNDTSLTGAVSRESFKKYKKAWITKYQADSTMWAKELAALKTAGTGSGTVTPAPTINITADSATKLYVAGEIRNAQKEIKIWARQNLMEVNDSTIGRGGKKIETASGKFRRNDNTLAQAVTNMINVMENLNERDSVLERKINDVDFQTHQNTRAIDDIYMWISLAKENLKALNTVMTDKELADPEDLTKAGCKAWYDVQKFLNENTATAGGK